MTCRHVSLAGGGMAIVCTRTRAPKVRRCIVCNVSETMASIVLCDAPLSAKKTCDAVLCIEHAVHIEPDCDYCPRHARGLEEPA